MTKPAFILLAGSLILVSCKKPAAPSDNDAASKAVAELFDTYARATKEKNFEVLAGTLAEDGLFLGTDPDEFWNKQNLMDLFKTTSLDATTSFDITMDKREIRISQDGMMAIVVEQSNIPVLSQEISIRGIGHARMVEGQWKIDFYSWSLIPQNEDLARLNNAMEK